MTPHPQKGQTATITPANLANAKTDAAKPRPRLDPDTIPTLESLAATNTPGTVIYILPPSRQAIIAFPPDIALHLHPEHFTIAEPPPATPRDPKPHKPRRQRRPLPLDDYHTNGPFIALAAFLIPLILAALTALYFRNRTH